MSSREGLTVDVVAKLLRRTALNPWLAVPLAMFLARGQAKGSPPLASASAPELHHALCVAAWSCALAGVILSINDWLNKWSANNWTATASLDWNWNREIALVTGASGGIGASIVQQLLARNPKTKIVVVDYSPLMWEPPAGTSVSYYQCDLSDACAVRALCSRIRSDVGHPTVLINNAGLCRGFTVMEGTYNDVELTVRTNLIAPFLLAKEVLPNMVKTNHGHIMHISSMSSLIPPARVADYAATKAGISALHEVRYLHHNYVSPFIDHGDQGSSTGIDARPQRPQCPPVSRNLQLHQDAPFQGGYKTIWVSVPPSPCRFSWRGPCGRLIQRLWKDHLHAWNDALRSHAGKLMSFFFSRYVADSFVLITQRGAPEWIMRAVREGTQSLGVDFKGRQKVDGKTGRLS